MNAMAATRPTELRWRHVPLKAGSTAPAEARSQVQEAILFWDVPVDPSVAALLTSELVTNAIRHETGGTVTLTIRCSFDQLRVDVYDTSRSMPVVVDASDDAETGRGLMLVATLSADWGFYRTSEGKAVFFTLACQADSAEVGGRSPQEVHNVKPVSHNPPSGSPSPANEPALPFPSPDREFRATWVQGGFQEANQVPGVPKEMVSPG